MNIDFILRPFKSPQLIAAGLLAFLVFAVYLPSLSNGFVWDDHFVVVENGFVKSPRNLPLLFTKRYLTRAVDMSLVGVGYIGAGEATYRPLVTLSYFADYAVWKLNPFGYHLNNLLLHIAATLAVYVLVWILSRNALAAFLAALMFGWHPVQTEAVCGIANREDLLASLFYLLSFICYVKLDDARRENRRLGLLRVLSLGFFFLALFSKEMATTLPLALLLYDYFYRCQGSLKQAFVCWRARCGGYLAVLGFYILVRFGLLVTSEGPQGGWLGGGYYPHILTMLVIITAYLKWLIFPFGIHHIVPEDASLLVSSVLNIKVLAAVVLIGGFLTTAIRLHRTQREVSFGIWFFFITLIPVANIIPLHNFMGPRFLYLPAAGFCMAAAALLARLVTAVPGTPAAGYRKAGRAFVAITLIFYAGLTWKGMAAYKNDLSFGKELARNYPKVARIRCILGTYYHAAGDPAKAMEEQEAALKLDPKYGKAYLCRGVLYQEAGMTVSAVEDYTLALKFDPDLWYAHLYLGNIYLRKGTYEQAREHYFKLLERVPRQVTAYNNLGVIYFNMGDRIEAERMWRTALKIDPGNAFARQRLAEFAKTR